MGVSRDLLITPSFFPPLYKGRFMRQEQILLLAPPRPWRGWLASIRTDHAAVCRQPVPSDANCKLGNLHTGLQAMVANLPVHPLQNLRIYSHRPVGQQTALRDNSTVANQVRNKQTKTSINVPGAYPCAHRPGVFWGGHDQWGAHGCRSVALGPSLTSSTHAFS